MPLIHITTCLLCADRTNAFRLEEPGFDASDVGKGQIPERLQRFQIELLGHIQKAANWEWKQLEKAIERHRKQGGAPPDQSQAKHFQAAMDFQARQALAQGTAIMNAYKTTDPALLQMREVARVTLNRATRVVQCSDADILQVVQKFNFDPDVQDQVVQFGCRLRDWLLEQGDCAPRVTEPARILV